MSAYAYYAAEAERWPCTGWTGLNKWEAETAIRRLCRHFKIGLPSLNLRGGSAESGRAGAGRLTMGVAGGWRLLAHELAHTWHVQRVRGPGTRGAVRWHGKVHRRLTDRILRYVERQGWHRAALAEAAAYREDATRSGRIERMAASPTPRQALIARREAQAKRLRTKIKGLTTRLKKIERSLAAFKRRAT